MPKSTPRADCLPKAIGLVYARIVPKWLLLCQHVFIAYSQQGFQFDLCSP